MAKARAAKHVHVQIWLNNGYTYACGGGCRSGEVLRRGAEPGKFEAGESLNAVVFCVHFNEQVGIGVLRTARLIDGDSSLYRWLISRYADGSRCLSGR